MVIVCPECATKFHVNSERIPDKGAKVRCARCKHVFLACKPIPTEEPVAIISEPLITPAGPEDKPPVATAEPTATEQSVEEENQKELAEDNPVTAGEEEEGFSYDQFRDLDTDKGDNEDFTFSDDEGEDPFSISAAADPAEELFSAPEEDEEFFSFAGPEDEPTVAEAAGSATEETEIMAAAADKSAAATKPLTKEEKIASIFADNQESGEEAGTEQPKPVSKTAKSSPTSRVIRLLFLLILGLAVIGGALYYINGPEQIERAIQQILGQQSRPAETGQITLSNLEGKFINNQEAGELFVIRGEATNNFKQARAAIQVKGIIFDQNGKPLLQKTIYCGNPINDQELQTLPFDKLEEMMRNQFGKALNNMKVNSKEVIPFVIAFRDLPKNLSEFSVDVTASEPAAK